MKKQENMTNPIDNNIINSPIGLLDSGVGGLSVLAQLHKIMPNQNYIFFGDTKNLPYGTKTPKQIFQYTKEILEFFITRNVKRAVIACNTTSAVAYDELREYFKDKLIIYPLIQNAAKDSIKNLEDNDTIAVLATRATVNSKKYSKEIRRINNKLNVIEIDCSGFVEIVENRLYDKKESIDLIKSKLNIAKEYQAKRIILGCTHYPYLIDIFKKIYNVEYFNPAVSIAQIVKEDIESSKNQLFKNLNSKINFCASSSPEEFKLNAKTFFEIKDKVELINTSETQPCFN